MTAAVNKILIMAGGTGGHVFPALAVAERFREQDVEIHWLGTKAGIESRVVPSAGFPIHYVQVSGLRGKGVKKLLTAPFQLLHALWQSLSIVKQVKPNGVLGMGGFVTGPGGLAAWLLRKPLVVHEQNAIAGMTNRYLSKMAKRVLTAFPNAFGQDVATEVVGNPIRQALCQTLAPDQRYQGREEPRRVLIIGGSLGALALNEMVPEALSAVAESLPLDIVHQCGEKHLKPTADRYQALSLKANVKPFIEDMAQAYAWADLVICRAGALTVSELMAVGVPAVLIPFPFAVDDHQTKNAEFLQQAGAGVVIQQRDTDAQQLSEQLKSLLSDRNQLLQMANKARELAKPDATDKVVQAMREVCHD